MSTLPGTGSGAGQVRGGGVHFSPPSLPNSLSVIMIRRMSTDLERLAAIGTWELTLPERTLRWSEGARALLGPALPDTVAALLGSCPAPDRPSPPRSPAPPPTPG
jgi:hypothetical protein